jgi:hypothetical protein
MKRSRITGIVFAILVAFPPPSRAEEFTASGTWQAGRRSGTWSAELSRDGDIISGSIDLRGLPVRRAEVSGTLRADEITFGIVYSDREIASFRGSMNMSKLAGTLTLANGTMGDWEGTWEGKSTFVPVTDGLSGAVVPPFDRGLNLPAVDRLVDVCELLNSPIRARMSGGGESALRSLCVARDRPELQTPGTASAQSSGGVSCNPGPPESNPPTPPTVAGDLANDISRPMQRWPRITQSEVTAMVSFVDVQHQALAYHTTQFSVETCSIIGHAYLHPTNGFTENPNQFVIPSYTGPTPPFPINPRSDPIGAPDSNENFHVAFMAIRGLSSIILAQSRSGDFGLFYLPPEQAIAQAGFGVDKPWFAIDWTSNLSRRNTQYLCWQAATQTSTAIWFSRRPPDGAWQPPIQISGTLTDPEGVQGCQVVVAPNSSVYVLWWQEVLNQGQLKSSIMGARLDDGQNISLIFNATPAGFTKPQDTAATADCGTTALKGHVRTLPFPSVDIHRGNGTVYVAFPRKKAGSNLSEIAFVRSTNQGVNWSTPIVLNASTSGDKFMPALAASPYNGNTVKVFWYDRRNDPNNVSIDVYGATSTNSGVSFGSNVRLTNGLFGVPKIYPNFDVDCGSTGGCLFDVSPCYMGDYNQLAGFPNQGGFLHAWGDNTLKFFDPQSNLNVPDPDIRAFLGC